MCHAQNLSESYSAIVVQGALSEEQHVWLDHQSSVMFTCMRCGPKLERWQHSSLLLPNEGREQEMRPHVPRYLSRHVIQTVLCDLLSL